MEENETTVTINLSAVWTNHQEWKIVLH